MKKICLLSLAFIAIVTAVRTQIMSKKPYRYQNGSKDRFLFDTLAGQRFVWERPLTDTFIYPQPLISPFDNMPIVSFPGKKSRYVFNNQKGFDVYQAWQDHMLMLKPDSTFSSNMPVMRREKKLQSLYPNGSNN